MHVSAIERLTDDIPGSRGLESCHGGPTALVIGAGKEGGP